MHNFKFVKITWKYMNLLQIIQLRLPTTNLLKKLKWSKANTWSITDINNSCFIYFAGRVYIWYMNTTVKKDWTKLLGFITYKGKMWAILQHNVKIIIY